MGKRSRRKGAAFERRVAKWLREDLQLGDFWRQTDETQQGNAGDVRDRSGSVPILLQVKKGAAPSPWKAMQEAEEATEDSISATLPIGIVHRDQRKPGEGAEQLVVMRPELLAAFLSVVENAEDLHLDPWGSLEGWHYDPPPL